MPVFNFTTRVADVKTATCCEKPVITTGGLLGAKYPSVPDMARLFAH